MSSIPDEAVLVSEIYNINNGIDLYISQQKHFYTEVIISNPKEFYPLLVRQCVPAAYVAGMSFENLIQFAIDIIAVLGSYGCANRGIENTVHFIHRMIIANIR